MSERGERLRALARGRLNGNERDRVFERGERLLSPAADVQVAAEALVEDCGAQRVALADVRDRRPGEFDAARGRTRSVGQLGRPGTERDEIEPYDLGRVRYGVPERESPFEVRERFRQAEDRLRLAAASTDAASASLLRPAAAQCGASSAADAAALRPSSSASRACRSSRSPGRIVV